MQNKPPPSTHKRKMSPLVRLLSMVFGVVVTVVGCGMGVRSCSFTFTALRTEGTVIAVVRTGTRGRAPVVRYQVDSKTYEMRGSSERPWLISTYTIGEVVPVLYMADHPSAAQIATFTQQWFGPLAFVGMGLGAAVMQGWRLYTRRAYKER
jgi:hypothetical protein